MTDNTVMMGGASEQIGASAAARTWMPLVEPGMLVAGVAGDVVGQVAEICDSHFLVDRSGALGLASDGPLSVPYERIHVMRADKMTLDLPSSQLDRYAVDQYAAAPANSTR